MSSPLLLVVGLVGRGLSMRKVIDGGRHREIERRRRKGFFTFCKGGGDWGAGREGADQRWRWKVTSGGRQSDEWSLFVTF